jgi:hypothetical protein
VKRLIVHKRPYFRWNAVEASQRYRRDGQEKSTAASPEDYARPLLRAAGFCTGDATTGQEL